MIMSAISAPLAYACRISTASEQVRARRSSLVGLRSHPVLCAVCMHLLLFIPDRLEKFCLIERVVQRIVVPVF
jgi:hypothetical protein